MRLQAYLSQINFTEMNNIVCGRCSVSEIIQLRRSISILSFEGVTQQTQDVESTLSLRRCTNVYPTLIQRLESAGKLH